MKRIFASILLAAFLLTLAACGNYGRQPDKSDGTTPSSAPSAEQTVEPDSTDENVCGYSFVVDGVIAFLVICVMYFAFVACGGNKAE